jgi:hypothetical protein
MSEKSKLVGHQNKIFDSRGGFCKKTDFVSWFIFALNTVYTSPKTRVYMTRTLERLSLTSFSTGRAFRDKLEAPSLRLRHTILDHRKICELIPSLD